MAIGADTGIDLERELDSYRRELTGYCYRMLGSGFEAEDAVQETMVRAWKAFDQFEGRSALRSWLYRIATNVCLDMLRGPQRRARPMDMGPAGTSESSLDPGLPREYWVQPIADHAVLPDDGDPAELAAMRDSVRLAFVAALQHLPARQRAVLILREVLKWQASEVAELLDTSVASVNSALQRARSTMASSNLNELPPTQIDDDQQVLLAKYIAAFERYDVDTLVSLLHEDAIQQMPPYQLWLRGRDNIGRWFLGQGIGCQGSRAIPVSANGLGGYAVYRPAGPGRWNPFSIQLVEFSDGKVVALHAFLYPELFELFGLPDHLEA